MNQRSHSYVPSFDLLPCARPDNFQNQQQMLFIQSRRELESFRSIDYILPQSQRRKIFNSNVSIQIIQQKPIIEANKEQKIRTSDEFGPNQTPSQSFPYTQNPNIIKKTGCVCKKTKCLKLYCQCFRKGEACDASCNCFGCSNTSQNHEYVQDIRTNRKRRSKNNGGRTYCNCRKSECKKKYCQCYNSGLKCVIQCHCQGCSNCQ